jgi:hypothetical protein
MVKCLVLVKVYGNNPRKLLNRMSENNDTDRKVIYFLFLLLLKSVLNLLCSLKIFHLR